MKCNHDEVMRMYDKIMLNYNNTFKALAQNEFPVLMELEELENIIDSWRDGNEDVLRCLLGQFEELEPYLYVEEDAEFASLHREIIANEIYNFILGGSNA